MLRIAVPVLAMVLALCLIPSAFAAAAAEGRMLGLLNADRARNGLGPLTPDPALAAVARAHSQDMVSHGFFSHNSPSTGDPEARLNRSGIAWRAYAENVSYNSSVEESEASLMRSPGHRANILNPSYDTVGIGIVQGARSLFVTQVFIKAGGGRSRAARTRRFHVPGF